MRNIITLILTVTTVVNAAAQWYSPTQYFSTPLAVNPATTGLIASDMRFSANYNHIFRAYGYSPLHHTNIAYDMPVLQGFLPKGDALGVGLMYRNINWDNSNHPSNKFTSKSSTMTLSLAYHKSIGKKGLHHVSLGTLAAYTNSFFSYVDTTLWQGSSFFYTYNLGLMYSGVLSEKVTVYGGGTVYQLPNNLLNNDNIVLPTPFEYHALMAGSTISLRKNTQLYINLTRFTNNGWHNWQVSSYARFLLNPKSSKRSAHMYAGALYRVDADLSPYVGFEVANVRLGLSSSFNVPAYPGSRRVNGMEISLIYKGKLGLKKNDSWHCPDIY